MKNFIYDLTTTVFLFLTAIIWGFAFLFQKTAMESLGPYYFTGFRFLLGTFLFLFHNNKDDSKLFAHFHLWRVFFDCMLEKIAAALYLPMPAKFNSFSSESGILP